MSRRTGTYERIVVPVTPTAQWVRAVRAAAQIASENGTIVVVCVVEVPLELPLEALFPDEEKEAHALLRDASSVVEGYGIRAVQRLERANSAATAILGVAEVHRAEMIVLGTKRRARGRRNVFGGTVQAVLHRARCRVMLVTTPAAAEAP